MHGMIYCGMYVVVCGCARCGFRKMPHEILAKRINPRANYLIASEKECKSKLLLLGC